MVNVNYKEIINEILVQKRSRNPHYSIRALARDLDIAPSSLVDILNDKKAVTPKIALKIATHLGLHDESLVSFMLPAIEQSR